MSRILILHLAVGVFMMAMGLMAGVRPHALLDVVLTQEQIRDRELADETLTLLKKGARNDSWWMFASGAILVASSLIALRRSIPAN